VNKQTNKNTDYFIGICATNSYATVDNMYMQITYKTVQVDRQLLIC